jgi:colanic acid/amylovoran biosynthesis glycosyltransferase
MSPTLGVLATNDLGASFIDKHIRDLLPGRTVAIGGCGSISKLMNLWPVSCPALFLDRWALGLSVRLACRAGLSQKRLRDVAVAQFLQRHKVSVVLGEYLDECLDFVPLLERMGLPYVVQGHGIDVSASLRKPGMAEQYVATYKSARAVLTRSEFHRQRLIRLGLSSSIVHVNPGGVDVPADLPRRQTSARKRFLAIGVMVPKKSPIYLLEAFRIAAATDPDITLDYIGGGALFSAALQCVDAFGLKTRVRLHGIASNETRQRLLNECGVFVQHSITDPETGSEEGLPAAIQEAMAHGMAVVSTRHAGIPEAVIEGKTGFLVDEGDVRGMADAFVKVTASAAEMGREGHLEALAKHDWRHERERLRHWLFGKS